MVCKRSGRLESLSGHVQKDCKTPTTQCAKHLYEKPELAILEVVT